MDNDPCFPASVTMRRRQLAERRNLKSLSSGRVKIKVEPLCNCIDISNHSSQAGLRADGAGESALPAEESPWRLRALSRERELLEFYKKTASISSRERENRITLLAVVLII